MSDIGLIFLVLSTIILFLHSLEGFSKEIQAAGKDTLKSWLFKATANRYSGFLLGFVFTGIVQSSSAVSALTVTLVDSGVLTLQKSLPVLLGANVGTATTAWMVSLKITFIGPVLIVLGGVASMIPGRFKILGKPVFYLGFIFFNLNLISQSLEPLRTAVWVQVMMSHSNNVMIGIMAGMVATVLLQSSSVVSGLAVILVQQNILQLPGAVAIIIGANIGTTSTALLASMKLSLHARVAALANFGFNLTGAILMVLILPWFMNFLNQITDKPYEAVAYAHLIMNLIVAIVFLPFVNQVLRMLEKRFIPMQETKASKASDTQIN
jgi:phosphate:Na+ symporter